MKKYISAILAIMIIFSFSACKKKGDLGAQTTTNEQGVVEYNTVKSFDYSDFKKENAENAITEGFKVTSTSEYVDKQVAKEIAAKEFSGDFTYTSIEISYDRTEGVWRVTYSAGSNAEHICIDETGKTVLIVKE